MEATRVEEARQALEYKILKLRNSLAQWRTREAEYEAFKEELISLNPNATAEDIIEFSTNFGGDIINEREIKDLLGYDRTTTRRTKSQVEDSLSKRVDVARKNVDTLQKQIDRAVTEFEQPLDATADTGEDQPVMEIYEEIDDVGNVLSSRLIRADPDSKTLDALFNNTIGKGKSGNVQMQERSSPSSKGTQDVTVPGSSPSEVPNSANVASEVKGPSTFLGATGPILELDENDNVIRSIPSTSEDITTHRAEVFENASTLGPIVATMDIEEESDFSEDDDENYDEDEHRFVIGRSREELEGTEWEMDNIRDNLTPEYIAEMEALVKKYNQPVMGNLGPQDVGFALGTSLNEPVPKASSTLRPHSPSQENEHGGKSKSARKGVRFAEELDIASEPTNKVEKTVEQPALPIRAKQATISDVVERAPVSISSNTVESGGKKRTSRFKTARQKA